MTGVRDYTGLEKPLGKVTGAEGTWEASRKKDVDLMSKGRDPKWRTYGEMGPFQFRKMVPLMNLPKKIIRLLFRAHRRLEN